MSGQPADDQQRANQWRSILTGTDASMRNLRRWWRKIPSSPRCKACAAPFRGPGRLLTSVLMHGASKVNPLLCNMCFGQLRRFTGGAEIEITVLFADIRGSTGLAERTGAGEFRALLQGFYGLASRAIERQDGMVDKFLGDGVMALFIPGFAGEGHAARGIAAAEELLTMAERPPLSTAGARVGVGVNFGEAFVGVLGADERLDFSALGDTVNVAARLGSLAGPGEMLVSRATWERAGRTLGGDPGIELRTVTVAGRATSLDVIAERPIKTAAN